MIFLSHNSRDKSMVEPIFLEFQKKYGDVVFYDSWSIQPGESIIGGMNKGLSSENVFILFWSSNAAGSKAVEVEWQTAFSKNILNGEGKFQVVRLDREPLPQILSDYKYLDFFQEGAGKTLDNLFSVIDGKNPFKPEYEKSLNLEVKIRQKGRFHFQYVINAVNHLEYNLIYGIYTNDLEVNLDLISMSINGAVMQKNYSVDLTKTQNGVEQDLNSKFIADVDSILQPGIEKIIDVKVDNSRISSDENINIDFVILNQKGESLEYKSTTV